MIRRRESCTGVCGISTTALGSFVRENVVSLPLLQHWARENLTAFASLVLDEPKPVRESFNTCINTAMSIRGAIFA